MGLESLTREDNDEVARQVGLITRMEVTKVAEKEQGNHGVEVKDRYFMSELKLKVRIRMYEFES